MKTEGGDVRQDADRVTDVALQKEEQNPATTEQHTVKATDGEVVADGEGNAAAVPKEPETYVSASSKRRNLPYICSNCLCNLEVSPLNPISTSV